MNSGGLRLDKLGATLKELRIDAGYKRCPAMLRKVEKQTGLVINPQRWRRIERGEQPPTFEDVLAVCLVLGKSDKWMELMFTISLQAMPSSWITAKRKHLATYMFQSDVANLATSKERLYNPEEQLLAFELLREVSLTTSKRVLGAEQYEKARKEASASKGQKPLKPHGFMKDYLDIVDELAERDEAENAR